MSDSWFCPDLGDRIAASLQAGADRTPVRIGPRAGGGGALIELLLSLLSLRLGVGIRCRPHDRAGGASNDGPGSGIIRSSDNRSDNRAADHSSHGARPRRSPWLNDDPLVGARIRPA